jgi:hypothetical protein
MPRKRGSSQGSQRPGGKTVKLKALIGALVVGALGAAVAFAAPAPNNHGRGHTSTTITTSTSTVTVALTPTNTNGKKPPKTGPGCRPQVTLVVKGTATGDGTASIKVTLNVTNLNGTQVTVNGASSNVSSIKSKDHLLETFRVCKADVTGKSVTAASVTAAIQGGAGLAPKKVVDQTQH